MINHFRIENKYKIELLKLDELYKFLGDNSANVLYPKRFIKSIYFDNARYSSYHNSIEGTVPRKKIRVRTYSNIDNFDSKNNFNLENKINSVEGRRKTVEKSIEHIKLLKEGIFDKDYGLMFPIVEVLYSREYYKIFNLRITLDTKIKYKLFKENNLSISDEESILEVKSNNLDNMNYIEENFYFMRTRFSKYCNAIERLNIT